jgi:myo-inositol-1(or 4)-monophosphatase
MSPELESICALLRGAAETEILPRFRNVAARSKADGSLVTAADLGAQQRLIEALADLHPARPLLGEEMDAAVQRRLLADAATGVWCLDPLDGTSNYACGFPYFAVSLALLLGGEAVLGAIYDPVREECFGAERGRGAWLNGAPLRLESSASELKQCLALVDLKRLPPQDLVRLGGDAPYRSQRNLGSVALDWCWLAAGRGQLYLHGGQKLWDHAAGRLIAEEAGASARLLGPGGVEVPPALSLEPRMAVAAASAGLLGQWLGWLGLPKSDQAIRARTGG